MWKLSLVYLLFGSTFGYRYYQDRIPNGDLVPHPCKPNYLWRGVGHRNPQGGSVRNKFGEDFAIYHKWNPELCQRDSDNDGLTNGQELGDPDCIWTEGSFPARDTNITHPGVCDPWGSEKCKDRDPWVSCDTGEFKCPAVESDDVFNLTLTFPRTAVPAQVTTYMCMTFDLTMLQSATDYHLIAIQPYTDNVNVMHHTDLYTCAPQGRPMTEPEACSMTVPGCEDMLSTWVLGMSGYCLHEDAGFKVNSKTRFMFQHHWNNPEKRSDYTDSSGLILYLTKNRRKFDAGLLSTGQTDLAIPPGQSRVVVTSSCSATCTKRIIQEPIYIMTGLNHMHYLGYEMSVEHYRNGVKLRDLTRDEYSYDSPVVYQYDPPIEILPGDNLETTCVYRSSSKKTTTFYGEGTDDEMCFGFFGFYPISHVTKRYCGMWSDVEFCLREDNGFIRGCDISIFSNSSHPEHESLLAEVLDNCNPYGGCRHECPAAIDRAERHPCLVGTMKRLVPYFLSWGAETIKTTKFFAALDSCNCPVDGKPEVPASTGVVSTSLPLLALLIFSVIAFSSFEL